LIENNVRFVVIGGLAISAYGLPYITNDLDICYSRTDDNLENIVSALQPFNPNLRGAPENLPFLFDAETLRRGSNFTFRTDFGDIDLLGEIAGVGTFEEIAPGALKMTLMGLEVKVISLEELIKAKRAAGRTKDLLVLPDLETLLELQTEEEEAN
jgi:predicted nucleotidyltransferase